ncbi:MAG TPA: hypothetical protein VIJ38_15690 [Acidobacteriaceae bacterium]
MRYIRLDYDVLRAPVDQYHADTSATKKGRWFTIFGEKECSKG